MPVEMTPSDPPLTREGSPYPQLDEVSPETKLTDTQADKLSNNSEDSGVVDWKDPKSVVEKNRQMLESQMSCDVMFYVGEKREKLGAHKYVLMTRSDVFLHMFNTDPDKTEFDVPDISADYFWEVLKHIYCEDQKLQVLSVVGILAAADRYKLAALKDACLKYLHNCLEISNACYLLVEVRKYDFPEEEKRIVSYIRKNGQDVLLTPGIVLLSKELLEMLLSLPDLDVDEDTKRDAMNKWAKENDVRKKGELHKSSQDLLNDPIQDYLYVEREDTESHRYILDSVTTSNLFAEPEELVTPENVEMPPMYDVPDGMSTITSTNTMRSRSSVHTYSRLPSCNMWPEMDMVTRLQEVHGCGVNDAQKADAISFNVDHDIYLFGFGIYGPKMEGEGKYQIDTVLTRKKRDIVLETIRIRGAGIILPVLFERPVKIDKNTPYTLEIYITGPDSHLGASGQSQVLNKSMLFKFNNAEKVKNNRSSVSGGQIPRLLFLPRNKQKSEKETSTK